MPKWFKVLLWTVGAFILLIVALWFALVLYIQAHKQEVLGYINEQVSEKIDGTLHIADMQPSFRTFPDVSVALQNVTLQDTQYHVHHHSLLQVQTVYAQLHLLSLLHKRINLLKATATGGTLYIYVDSTGYSNAYLLQGKEQKKEKKKGMKFSCHHFGFENVRVIMDEQKKQKLFNILVKQADGLAIEKHGVWQTHIQLDAVFNSFAFNKEKGSFLKNAHLVTNLQTDYNPSYKKLFIKNQPLQIDGQPIIFGALFIFDTPPKFYLHIQSETVPFEKVTSWLSYNIGKKLKPLQFAKPMPLNAWLKGNVKYRDTPSVLVQWQTTDNTMQTPYATLEHVSFSGSFRNVTKEGLGHSDRNSCAVLHHATATWYGIPLKADSVRVDNIGYPLLTTSFHTGFQLAKLNKVPDSKLPFSFKDGAAIIDVFYKGGVKSADTLPPFVKGRIAIKDGDITYLRKGLHFTKVATELLLQGDDLIITKADLKTGNSTLQLKGEAAHFFRLYFSDPGKATINLQAQSKMIDIKDFIGFTGSAKAKKRNPQDDSSKGASRMIDQMNVFLDQSSLNVRALLGKIQYNHFAATDFSGTILMNEKLITLTDVNMNNAAGTIKLSGNIAPDKDKKPFALKGQLDKLQADKFFYAFNNFGQATITDTNINGTLNAQIALTGQLNDSGKIMPRSLDGNVDFSLINGRLQNLKPLKTIAGIVFRNRDFSDIRFQKISNNFTVRHEKILIPPMDIVSSFLYLHMQGVYSLERGTDITIDIPLRNPKKDGADTAYLPKIPTKKGIVVHLHAHDDDEGKVKISWDPFKKGQKTTDTLNYKQ